MEVLADVVGIVTCLVLGRYSLIMTLDSWRIGSITIKNLVFPEWWLLAPLPLVLLLLTIEFVFRLHGLFTGGRGPRTEATSVG
jgi:TRAP-type C4-dicarboxylate transport system permease small subunit